MIDTLNALIPVFMVIVTGVMLLMSGIIPAEHWRGIENLTYYVMFPATIIMTMATADLSSLPVLGIGGALAGAVLTMTALLLLLRLGWKNIASQMDQPSPRCFRGLRGGIPSSPSRLRARSLARKA